MGLFLRRNRQIERSLSAPVVLTRLVPWTGLTRLSILTARFLKPYPSLLRLFLVYAKNYIDWRGCILLCQTEFGAKISCRMSDLIQRKIAYFGVWEPALSRYIQSGLGPGDVFVDVGANIGYFSLLAGSLVGPEGKVVAVEASPTIFRLLFANVQQNKFGNIRPAHVAAAYAPGQVRIALGPSENLGATRIAAGADNASEVVEARPLHDILSTEELRRVKIIKIDIEGSEGPVLRSFLENHRLFRADCELAVEISRENAAFVEDMRRLGYNAYTLVNSYSDDDYLERRPLRPERLVNPITQQTDVIFSRRDAAFL
ncbi:MAG TPA: FkbM family methyltransferase [Rhizomicrobium sp.]|nr:FkbM family methyltransferase [Rhizomicrobium sp.]